MSYVNGNPNTSPASPGAVSLRSLSRSNKSKSERTAIAAGVLDQRLAVSDLSTPQLALLFGTTASAISKHRVHRGGGRRKLTLADRLLRASPSERVEAARVVGAQMIWETMIVPVCEEDRAPVE